MATKNYEVKGLKELQKQLLEFDKNIMKNATRRAAKEAMAPVAERARANAPVDTGNLRDSIKLSAGSTQQNSKDRVAWAVGKAGGRSKTDENGRMAGHYVLSQHYGNSTGLPENPFLLLAIKGYENSILADFKRELTVETEKGVKKMARKHKVTKGT